MPGWGSNERRKAKSPSFSAWGGGADIYKMQTSKDTRTGVWVQAYIISIAIKI